MKNQFPIIPVDEFHKRLEDFKRKMDSIHVDLAVIYSNLCDPSAVRYFSDVSPINENIALLIPLEGDPILCSGQACHEWSKYHSKIDDIRIMPEVGEVAGTEYNLETLDFEDLFREIDNKYNIRKVGYIGELIIPYCITSKAEKVFNKAEFTFIDKVLYEMRCRKSKNELEVMEKASDIISHAFEYAVPRVKEGMTELDIEADITSQFLRCGAESACYALTPMIGSGTERSTLCQARNSLRKVKDGEIISTVGGCCYEGYNGVISTPIVTGKVPTKISDIIKVAHECQHFMADKLMPGVTGKELVECYHDFLHKAGGYEIYSPYGAVHSIGMIECEYPFFGPTSDTVLEENMTVAIDVYFKGLEWGSFRIEDTYAVTANGAKMLTWFNKTYIPERFK